MPVVSQNISVKSGVGPVLADSGKVCLQNRYRFLSQSFLLLLHCLSFLPSFKSYADPVLNYSGVYQGSAPIMPFSAHSYTNSPFPLAKTVNSACSLHRFLYPFSKIFPIEFNASFEMFF